MHLQISEEQDALRDAVARFLDKASTAEAVREAEPLGFDRAVWRGLVDVGVPALGVGEDLGGSGASFAASVLAGHTVPDIYSALIMSAAAAVFSLDRRRR